MRAGLVDRSLPLSGVATPVGGFVVLDRMYPPDLLRLDLAGAEVLQDGRTLAMLPAPGGVWLD